MKRRDYNGQPWALSQGTGYNYGVVSNVRLSDWTIRAGLFRSLNDNGWNYTDLALNLDEQGMADHVLIVDKDRRFGSVSGEFRLSREIDENDRRHIIPFAARGRQQKRVYGGAAVLQLGRARFDERIEIEKPEFEFGPKTNDTVTQFTGGIGYEGRWRGKGELTLGLQKTKYKKEVETPTGFLPTSNDSPWLMNGTVSVYATKDLVFYAGYTKGLEESDVAPESARNKDEAPPAIITVQKDAGFRYAVSDRLRFIAGVFDVKKPYFALDDTKLFTNLGTLRHRGVELSLSGQLAKGLNVVAGTVFLDAEVSGKEVDQGQIGKRPIGAIPRATSLALDYQVPWIEGLSVDLFYESTSKRIANRKNSLHIPARYVVNPGFRYRFDLAGNPSVLRGQVGTLNNVYGYGSAGEGFFYNVPRRYTLSLTTDL